MRCKKCEYITFDFYNECPKCGTSFKEIKEKLNIIDYSISEENNYLIDEKLEEPEKKEEEQETIETQESQPEIEHTKVEDKEEAVPDEEGISISEFLETTKLEDE